MKKRFNPLSIVLSLWIFQPAFAVTIPPELDPELTKQDRAVFAKDLQEQTAKVLETQKGPSCESPYQEIFADPEVRVTMAYGYLDAVGGAVDAAFAKTMVEHLELPCKMESLHVQTCGFQVKQKEQGMYELTKNLKVNGKEKKVVLTVFAPALTWSDRSNQNVQKYYFEQRARSDRMEKAFHDSLQNSQVVFYNGHSVRGAGPAFHTLTEAQILWNRINQKSMSQFIKGIQTSSNLKMLGLFACESEKLYEKKVLDAAPDLAVISATDFVVMKEGHQSLLGSLNSILTRKCKSEFEQSTVPSTRPQQDIFRVKNFFEYSKSATGSTAQPSKTSASPAAAR